MGMVEKKKLVANGDEATQLLISDAFRLCETGYAVMTARNGAGEHSPLGRGVLFVEFKGMSWRLRLGMRGG